MSKRDFEARKVASRLSVEVLEDRLVPAGPPAGIGMLPSVTAGLTQAQIDHADAVINWETATQRAVWIGGSSPTVASRIYAMVGVAMYDAVNAITPIAAQYPVPGLTGSPAAGASAEAAAIGAADTVLRALYPAQTALFDAEKAFTLGAIPDGAAKTAGLAWGQTVGSAVVAWRSTDDVRVQVTPAEYAPAPPGGPIGVYELTPNTTFALTPQWGKQQTWALANGDQFLSPPPPALDSVQYATDFNEVKAYGSTTSTVRTADQTQIAHFWADVPSNTATPPGHMTEIAMHVALIQGQSLAANARLFGMIGIGVADAAINCWEAKYVYNFWRPITAIRDARANSINSATTSDSTWTPLWGTPNFPSYTSGHSTFSGTTAAILTSLYGPNFHFTMGSDDMPGTVRSFNNFFAAASEAADSRMYGGIHFRFDNNAGLVAGLQIGNFIAQNFLQLPTATAFLQVDPHQWSKFNLVVTGTNGNDVIVVSQVGSNFSVNATGRALGSFSTAMGILGITVDARDGNDVVTVSSQITLAATLMGGKGSDILNGGSGNDSIYGGDGTDYVFGNDGDDYLSGDAGTDYVYGGNGNDQLLGGAGDDWLFGGLGTDLFTDVEGNNHVFQ